MQERRNPPPSVTAQSRPQPDGNRSTFAFTKPRKRGLPPAHMKKVLPNIAAVVLGVLFLMASIVIAAMPIYRFVPDVKAFAAFAMRRSSKQRRGKSFYLGTQPIWERYFNRWAISWSFNVRSRPSSISDFSCGAVFSISLGAIR